MSDRADGPAPFDPPEFTPSPVRRATYYYDAHNRLRSVHEGGSLCHDVPPSLLRQGGSEGDAEAGPADPLPQPDAIVEPPPDDEPQQP